jgi:hypothetical protein
MAAASILLPFLPMLPTQILLNNFLYDLAQNRDSPGQRRPLAPGSPAAVECTPYPGFHDFRRTGELDLRLPDVLCPPFRPARQRNALSHRMVRGVACDANARPLRDPDDGKPVEEPPQPRVDGNHPGTLATVPAFSIAGWWQGCAHAYTRCSETTGASSCHPSCARSSSPCVRAWLSSVAAAH